MTGGCLSPNFNRLKTPYSQKCKTQTLLGALTMEQLIHQLELEVRGSGDYG